VPWKKTPQKVICLVPLFSPAHWVDRAGHAAMENALAVSLLEKLKLEPGEAPPAVIPSLPPLVVAASKKGEEEMLGVGHISCGRCDGSLYHEKPSHRVTHRTCACALYAGFPDAALTREEEAMVQVFWFLQRRCCTLALALAIFVDKDPYEDVDEHEEKIAAVAEKVLAPPCEGCTEPGRRRSDCNASCCPVTLGEPRQPPGCIKAFVRQILPQYDYILWTEHDLAFNAFADGTAHWQRNK